MLNLGFAVSDYSQAAKFPERTPELSPYVAQMRPLLVICQICTNSLGHRQHKRAIGHIQPVRSTNKLIGCVAGEWTIRIRT